MNRAKKWICILLGFTMLLSTIPAGVLAKEQNAEIEISANSGSSTISVTKPEVTPPENPDDEETTKPVTGETITLFVEQAQAIERDYDQTAVVQVRNISEDALTYYLQCDNGYADIYMNFVKAGSEGAPLTIQPGETQQILLSIFAQNAQRQNYTVPVTAVVAGGERVTMNLVIFCTRPETSVSFMKKNVNEHTLATEYVVANNGTEQITDLTLSVDGEAREYVRISPGIENYLIKPGESVTVTLIPDLMKMDTLEKTLITGKLVASGGVSASEEISFDTKGEPITTTTMAELGYIQEGNKYHDIAYDEAETDVITSISGEDVSFNDVTKQYYEEGNPEKDGVNTSEEFLEVIGMIVDKEGRMDFTITETMHYEDNSKDMPITVRIQSEFISPSMLCAAVAEGGTYYDAETDQLVTKNVIRMTEEEYWQYLEKAGDAGEWLKIENLPNNIFSSEDDGAAKEVLLTITTGIGAGALNLPEAITKAPTQYIDFSKTEMSVFNNIVDASKVTKPLQIIGTAGDAVGTAVDIGKTYQVISNPNVDTGDKVLYSGIQVAKNVNRWVGGKLLSKAGATLGTSIGDGPGAIIGFFAGHVLSGLLEFGMNKWLDSLEDDMYASYYDIYGSQCTNAGQVTSDFYVSDLNIDMSGTQVYETGRMYDGTPYGGNSSYAEERFGGEQYDHQLPVTYDYILNGKEVGETQNTGLTQVAIVKLDDAGDALTPGEVNTLVRDYDTDPGDYKVTADTEITILYPADTPISYIGEPKDLENVRRMPDFAVYAENITAKQAPIIGEKNELTVNVYNRGSSVGWTDITVKDGAETIYFAENVQLNAFSEHPVIIGDWTPQSEENAITVFLVNKGYRQEERKTENNSASRVIKAREREIVQIGQIEPAVVRSDSDIIVTAALTQVEDLQSVQVNVNSAVYDAELISMEGEALACANIGKLSAGEHTLTVSAVYQTGSETTASVSKAHTICVNAPVRISFAIDDTVKAPQFSIFAKDNYSKKINAKMTLEGGQYTVLSTKAMETEPAAYEMMVVCEGGVIVVPVDELNGKTLSLAHAKKVQIKVGEAELRYVRMYSINNKELPDTNIKVKNDNTFCVSGITDLQLEIGYRVQQMTGYEYAVVSVEEADAVIDLTAMYKVYEIPVSDQVNVRYFGIVDLLIEERGYSRSISVSSTFLTNEDGKGKTLYLLCGSDDLALLERTEKVKLLVTTGDTIFIEELSEGNTVLDRAGYRKISIVAQDSGTRITDVDIELEEIGWTIGTSAQQIYVPAGSYNVEVVYEMQGGYAIYSAVADTVAGDATISLPSLADRLANVKFSWPEWFSDEAYVQIYRHNGRYYSYTTAMYVEIGESIWLEEADYQMKLRLQKEDENRYNIYNSSIQTADISAKKGQHYEIQLGSRYTGSCIVENASAYEAGKTYFLRLKELKDENGNTWEQFRVENTGYPLVGELILTNPDAGKSYTLDVKALGLENIAFSIPDTVEEGRYTYSVKLRNSVPGEQIPEEDAYEISASATAGGNITPNGTVKVKKGEAVTFTITANRNGTLEDVLVDGETVGAVGSYTFENVTSDHTIKAIFKTNNTSSGSYSPVRENEDDGNKEDDSGTISFSDVSRSDWFYDDVKYVSHNGLMNGTEPGYFSPNMTTNRGMIVTILYRLADQPAVSEACIFTDVPGGSYYENAITWAAKEKIVTGYSSTRFGPEDPITREQLAAILYRYAEYRTNNTENRADLNGFADTVSVSGYARNAVAWAVAEELINGVSADTLNPSGHATRAQAAAILHRFCVNIAGK